MTLTTTASVVETDVVSYTETATDYETATETVTDATVTVTTTLFQGQKRTVTTGKQTPTYASVCKATQAYLTACNCIDAVARTTTLPCQTVTSTVTSQYTASPRTITSSTNQLLTTTGSTETIITTFSTSTIPTTVETDTVTTTDATTTLEATATSVETVTAPPPIQTFTMLANYAPAQQPNTNIYAYNRPLNSDAYFIDFTSDPTVEVIFGLNPADQSISVLDGPASGDLSFYSQNVGATSFILVATADFAASQGGVQIKCTISTGTLACEWKTPGVYDAELWLCGGHLNLVQPGYDFTNSCNAGGTAFKISVTTVPQ